MKKILLLLLYIPFIWLSTCLHDGFYSIEEAVEKTGLRFL